MDEKSMDISRRQFLSASAKVSAGAVAISSAVSRAATKNIQKPHARIIGANERINVAVVGIRSRGQNHINAYLEMPNVQIKALCDIDGNVLEKRTAEVTTKQGSAPDAYNDYQQMLQDKDIDAVSIATQNYWHALQTVWACQAGKHVYVEKPACHNIWEGRKMVEAARKYGVLVQVGFQNRSLTGVRKAMKFLAEGGIGEVYMARGLCYKPRTSIGICKDGIGTGAGYEYFAFNRPGQNYDQAYMDKVDYDKWIGPAPKKPFNYNRFHYNWHWQWDYGAGDIGNQGPHQFDIARWGLGKNEHPVKISSQGGFYGTPCDQETPNFQTANIEYADGKMLVFEVRGLSTNTETEIKVGNLFYGTKGWMHLNGPNWSTYFGYTNEPGPSSSSEETAADPMNAAGAGGGGHFGNFMAAVASGKQSDLTCEIEEGHMSTALPLLANISYRLDNKTLHFDGEKEKFKWDWDADRLLKRKYRRPYVMPNNV